MDFIKLVEYGTTGIALGVVIALIYLVRYFIEFVNKQRCDYLGEIEKMEVRHNSTYRELSKTIKKNTQVGEQTYQYLKLRNGHLESVLNKNKGEQGIKGDKGERGKDA